jgi:hypothetical protein
MSPRTTPPSARARRTSVAPPRDQHESAFHRILEALVKAQPSARAAALFDAEGETVDYAGQLDPFEVKVAAAHWQIVLAAWPETLTPRSISVRARHTGFVLRPLDEGYALVLILHPLATFAVSTRALASADLALRREAGLGRLELAQPWYPIEVEPAAHDRRRPSRVLVDRAWHDLEVLGALVGLGRRERGFRVRLVTSGAELMLVREPSGAWYVDEPLQTPEPRAPDPTPSKPIRSTSKQIKILKKTH